eukprot:1381871-Amorphochlora_amoeboformis.AAC.1
MTAVVGTLAYMAPELMPSEFPFTSDSIEPAAYGLSADIFSFGYVAWEILSRRLPYYALKVRGSEIWGWGWRIGEEECLYE